MDRLHLVPQEIAWQYNGIEDIRREDITISQEWRLIQLKRLAGTIPGVTRAIIGANPNFLRPAYLEEVLMPYSFFGRGYKMSFGIISCILVCSPLI